jgi:hypothetical protein
MRLEAAKFDNKGIKSWQKDNKLLEIVAFKYSIPIPVFLQQKQKNCL